MGKVQGYVALKAQSSHLLKLIHLSFLPSSYSYVPYVGYMTIVLNDYPKLKYALLGLIGVSVLFSGEDS